MAEEKKGTQRKQLENNLKSNDQVLQICLWAQILSSKSVFF